MQKISTKILITILAHIFFVSVPLFTVYAQENTLQSSSQKDQVIISFDNPIPLNSFANKIKDSSFDSASVQSSFSINGRTFQDFVTVTSAQKVEEIRKNFLGSRQSIIATLKKDGFFDEKISSSEISKDINTSGVVNIKNITLYGEKQAISKVAYKFVGAKVEYKSDQEKVQSLNTETNSTFSSNKSADQSASNVPYYTLVPKSGTVRTGTFTYQGVPTRGVANYMRWDVNNFASDQTYEHDFFLSNTTESPGTYFARKFSSPANLLEPCIPSYIYFVTTWGADSKPFVDTDLENPFDNPPHFCTNSGSIAFSIGAAQANAIKTGMTHITVLLMPDGDAVTDTFILQGQVGYRFPSGCFKAVCSFPYKYPGYSPTHYPLVKKGEGIVPGIQSWIYNGQPPYQAPSDLVVKNAQQEPNKLELTFKDNTFEETRFSIERKTGNSTWSSVGTSSVSPGAGEGVYWKDSNTPAGTSCYRVKAVNDIGSSSYSNEACGTTLGGVTTPLSPSEVSVSGATVNSLRVYFKDNAINETNIYIERKTEASGTWSQVLSTLVLPGTSNWVWTNGGLGSGTTYCYRLRAYNASGYSSYSPEACGVTTGSSGTVPLSPSNVSISDATSNSLKVNFKDNSVNETSFTLERKIGTGGTFVFVANINAFSGNTNQSYVNIGLSSNTIYCFRLKALNNAGSSGFSNEACGITSSISTIPNAPSELSVTDATASSLKVNYRDNAINENNFSLERKVSTAGGWFSVANIDALSGVGMKYYGDTNLSSGTTYCYRIRAYNNYGYSAYSNEGCGTTTSTGTAPSAPSDVSVSNATANSLRVNFKDNALNENSFTVERKVNNGGFAYLTSISALSGNYFQYITDNNLTSGVTYCYRIFASNNYGNSSYSNESCGTTTSTETVPNAPSNVFISNSTTNSLRINFKDNSTNETWFPIERKMGNGNWIWLKSIQALTGTYTQWITDSGLNSRTQYCYRMLAINASGASPYSNEACGTTF